MELGTGPIKSASSALTDGSRIPKENAWLFLINAPLALLMVTASLATKDMTSSMENVSSLPPTVPDLPILDALPGIGPTKSASLAHVIGSRAQVVNVFPSLTSAVKMLPMVTAPLAIKDTNLKADNVFCQLSTMPSPPTLDAKLGTGSIKSALLALISGSRMLTEYVFPFPTNVLLTLLMATVSLVSRDMISSVENVSSLNPTMPTPPISDVPLGTGPIKSASFAPTDG